MTETEIGTEIEIEIETGIMTEIRIGREIGIGIGIEGTEIGMWTVIAIGRFVNHRW